VTYAGARPEDAEMGANQSGLGGPGGPGGGPGEEKKKEKKKWQPPPPPQRVGKKLKKKGIDGATRLPDVAPASKCLLRKLKLERVKDWLLMEEEFVTNQEQIKPHTERAADDQSKVDELRGSPMSVGNLEEIIDDKCVRPTRVVTRLFTEPRSAQIPISHTHSL
jgi:26S proteasome regulatory subunit T2